MLEQTLKDADTDSPIAKLSVLEAVVENVTSRTAVEQEIRGKAPIPRITSDTDRQHSLRASTA